MQVATNAMAGVQPARTIQRRSVPRAQQQTKRLTQPQVQQAQTQAGDQDQVGARAALRYAGLAARALLLPMRQQIQQRLNDRSGDIAMRAYLIACCALYFMAGVALLFPLSPVGVHRTGLSMIDDPAARTLWGLGALLVAASQIVAVTQLSRSAVWTVCATITAMWASGWAVVMFFLAQRYDNYASFIWWAWTLSIHFIFLYIGNRLVGTHATPHVHTATAADDQHVLSRLQEFAQAETEP